MIGEKLIFSLKSCHSIFEERQGNLFHVRKSHLLRNLLAFKKLIFYWKFFFLFLSIFNIKSFPFAGDTAQGNGNSMMVRHLICAFMLTRIDNDGVYIFTRGNFSFLKQNLQQKN